MSYVLFFATVDFSLRILATSLQLVAFRTTNAQSHAAPMNFDISDWLNVLKASAWQYVCLALACAALLFGNRQGWLPVDLDPTYQQLVLLAGFACAALWIASIGSALTTGMRAPWNALRRRRALQVHAKEFRDYIPHMTRESRAVIAQLLHENHKDFTGAVDGGYAATLIGRGFVVLSSRPGQLLDYEDVPFKIPDHIWNVALEQKGAISIQAKSQWCRRLACPLDGSLTRVPG